jgi:hypothetical protein
VWSFPIRHCVARCDRVPKARYRGIVIVTALSAIGLTVSSASAFSVSTTLFAKSTTLVQAAPAFAGRYSGKIESVDGANVKLRLRSGQILYVDISPAVKKHLATVGVVGQFLQVEGALTAPSMLSAQVVRRVKGDPAGWASDSP